MYKHLTKIGIAVFLAVLLIPFTAVPVLAADLRSGPISDGCQRRSGQR